ncbi:mitochondrial import receptor subunit TOM20 homolog isoform X2 [Teleopsis dalmanni]|uniref:mitochondrial import receptor subunit TOM20 homolog isoform X2 n=1 Tax=Teleopsis dalmanni TaxID=139649 RepID=UPI0018CCFF1C|nr:mitochondrial import receptor subunit TOM20 homolog isoform X2 [Teleopsis dalmanni]
MIELSKTVIGIAAGVAGRRQHHTSGVTRGGLPNLNDHKAIERYFLQEIQLGETLISKGDYERGVEHLANAIVVCGQPAELLQVLQSSLPAQVFAMLIIKMQELGNRSNTESNEASKMISLDTAGDTSSTKFENSSDAVLIDDLE